MKNATIALHRQNIWRDYSSLMKSRVILLHLITAAAAMFLAANGLPRVSILIFTLLGGGLMAAAANALNCFFDRDIDKLMERTRQRPLPEGRVSPGQTLIFSALLGLAGFYILTHFINWVAACLALGALVYYILIYTLWLKRRTRWSSLIGSGVGAFPMLIGWYAVTGAFSITPFLLSALIIFWTPPHFWSLAIVQRADYSRVGIKAIPDRGIRGWIGCFSLLLIGASLAIKWTADLSFLYLGAALLLGILLLILVASLLYKEDDRFAKRLYWYSMVYLALLFGSLWVDTLAF